MTDDPQDRVTGAAGRAKRELDRARDVELGPPEIILARGLSSPGSTIAVKAMLNEGLGEETGYILLMAAAVVDGRLVRRAQRRAWRRRSWRRS